MDLAKVWLRWIFALQVEMLRGATTVGVAFDPFTRDESHKRLRCLGEAVVLLAGCSEDDQRQLLVIRRLAIA